MFFEVNEIRKNFGGLVAVDSLSFAVNEGEVTSVIGPNGAGKTTLFNLITGVIAPDEGDIYFKDERITGKPPHKIYHLGLARSFQITNIFQGLPVFENIRLAGHLLLKLLQYGHRTVIRFIVAWITTFGDVFLETRKRIMQCAVNIGIRPHEFCPGC